MEHAVGELLSTWGIPVEQRRLTVDELKGATNVLMTNALIGAVPVIAVDGAAIAADVDLCRRINDVLFNSVATPG
jgi:branched-subunit amino acid aminotransferase/4-amino-4-deoxychorismate lyase